MVGRATVPREQQEAETDLGDEQRLRERQQLRDGGAHPPAPPGEERDGGGHDARRDYQECVHVMGR